MTPRLVQIKRHSDFDESAWYGFVLFETDSLMLLQYVSDRYDLDGFRCIRKEDVVSVSDDFERRDFVRRALRIKGLQCSPSYVTLVDDIRILMRTIPSACELVAIHRELVCPGECEIGRMRESDDETCVLDWITPNGEWEPDNYPFRFADVTRLDWGDEYCRTLLMVNADRNR